MKTTAEQREALLVFAMSAPPRPWRVTRGDGCLHVQSADRAFETGCVCASFAAADATADLIAEGRNYLPDLIADLDEVLSTLARLKNHLDEARSVAADYAAVGDVAAQEILAVLDGEA